jgi:hypothetical protein
VFDLPHDFPDHVVMRLARRRLDLAVNTESHVLSLTASGSLYHVIRAANWSWRGLNTALGVP